MKGPLLEIFRGPRGAEAFAPDPLPKGAVKALLAEVRAIKDRRVSLHVFGRMYRFRALDEREAWARKVEIEGPPPEI